MVGWRVEVRVSHRESSSCASKREKLACRNQRSFARALAEECRPGDSRRRCLRPTPRPRDQVGLGDVQQQGAWTGNCADCLDPCRHTGTLGTIAVHVTIALTDRLLAYRVVWAVLVAGGALVCGYAVVSPDGHLLQLLYLLIALSLVLALTPQSFIAASVLAFAVSTSINSPLLPFSPVPVYFSDVVVLLIAMRGAVPRDRRPAYRALSGLPTLLFALWAVVMAIAALRAINAGVPYPSAIRGDLALAYWPLLYFGFTRVLRERALDVSLLWRNLAVVALGLAGWMFLARALNHPFEGSGLAGVATGENTSVRRDFGFAGAFIVYPALALVGIAVMAQGGGRRSRWGVLAAIGTVATLMTLVRGEIFSLALAALVILWLRPRNVGNSARVETAIQIVFAVGIVLIGLIAVNPTLGNAVVQRAVPFTHQAPGAEANAEYRWEAVRSGFRVARDHPAGLGVLDVDRLDAQDIDRGYLAHSGVATLLLFGGWLALGSGLLTLLSVLGRSFHISTPTPWLHSAFVGVLLMLGLYSITAAGLAGDQWVIPLGALAVALRFTLQPLDER